jgi:hypothetical protein
MVATQQNFWHFSAPENPRAGILGVFDYTWIVMSFFGKAFGITQNAGHQTNHTIDQNHCRDFTAIAYEVTYRNFARLQANPDSLIEAFVSAT